MSSVRCIPGKRIENGEWRHDYQQNDVQHKDKYNVTLSVVTLSITALDTECCCVECSLCSQSFLLSVINNPLMLSGFYA